MKTLAAMLPLKYKLSGKLQCFHGIDRSNEMLKNK